MSKEVKSWKGDTPFCNFCHELPLGPDDTFVDGQTKMGPWAIMCESHFACYGVGVGLGKGQRYRSAGRKKVEG